MSTIEKLLMMQSVPNAAVWLFWLPYADKWTCNFEIDGKSEKVKLSFEASTPDAAVDLVYYRWNELCNRGMKEFAPTLLMAPADFQSVQPSDPDADCPF